MESLPSSFGMVFCSDPQYPWYDEMLPEGLTTEDQIKENSARQIREQYESVNRLAQERRDSGSPFQVEGVVINGDLTAFGHDWQYEKYTELLKVLAVRYYPGLGNHDYSNNVDDSVMNNCASRMVDFMHSWLKSSSESGAILGYDFTERAYYQAPALRTDYEGSLAYSFNIGKAHFVQLQNFPSYADSWDRWDAAHARRDYYYIREAFYWLRNDLALARNRGDIVIVALHQYGDNFIEPALSQFNQIVKDYGVSAVFAGHVHGHCRRDGTVYGTTIPLFRSGAASHQDYLVADIDAVARKMTVQRRFCPYEGQYEAVGDSWEVTLDDTLPSPPLPVPPKEGFVSFKNGGGFVARFTLQYLQVNGERVIEKTGNMTAGETTSYNLPPDSTDVWLVGEEKTGLAWEGWRTVFDLHYPAPPDSCFRLYGTTLHPKWEQIS